MRSIEDYISDSVQSLLVRALSLGSLLITLAALALTPVDRKKHEENYISPGTGSVVILCIGQLALVILKCRGLECY